MGGNCCTGNVDLSDTAVQQTKSKAGLMSSKNSLYFDLQPGKYHPINGMPTTGDSTTRQAEEKFGPFDWSKTTPSKHPRAFHVGPVQFNGSGVIFSGQAVDGMKNGIGTQVWPEGSKYEGEWVDGKACGYGRMLHFKGDVYEGQWNDDMAEGYGVYSHPDGSKYEGNWLRDKQHGKGIETWENGNRFEGYFKHGEKEGEGKFTWADGSHFVGEFSNNQINGRGKHALTQENTYGIMDEYTTANGRTI